MKILLMQLDGRLPNLALAAIAAHHRAKGDHVELRSVRRPDAVAPDLFSDQPDQVYASLIFERSRPIAREVCRLWPSAIIGGTGWDLQVNLEQFGIDANRRDFADYPSFRQSIGFTQRGCRLNCPFCVVPKKEGKARSVATIPEIWRGEPWPRELILLDNDFFGQPDWRERIKEIRDGGFKVNFCQGINARLLSDEAAAAIASVDYRASSMKYRQIYTAWDSRGDEAVLFRGLEALVRHGVKPVHITVYILIGFWAGETEADWLYRQQRLREFGAMPYPMPYVRNALTVGFQRWCVAGYDKRIPWDAWKRAKCEPRKLGHKNGRLALPLFADLPDRS